MAQMNARGKEARDYFIDCETRLRQTQRLPQLTTIEMLEGAVAALKAKDAELAEQKRIKALITERREASAMGTASAAVRKLARAEDALADYADASVTPSQLQHLHELSHQYVGNKADPSRTYPGFWRQVKAAGRTNKLEHMRQRHFASALAKAEELASAPTQIGA